MLTRLRQLLPKASEQNALTAGGADSDKKPLAILEFQSPTAAVIAEPFPFSARWTNWMITFMVVCMLFAAWSIEVQQLVISQGVLVSTAPDVVVQNFNSTAILKDLKVKQGEYVHRGQVLATIDPTFQAADFNALSQQANAYQAQVDQLQAQENGKPYLPDPTNPAATLQYETYQQQVGQYNATMESYTQQINQLQTEVNGYNGQAAYYKQRLGIASSIQGMYTNLQKQEVGSALSTLDATDTQVSMQASYAQNVSSAASTQKQLDSVKAQQTAFDQQWRAQISQDLANAENSLTETRQSLEKAQLANQLVDLVAPEDAIVQSVLDISVGGVMQAGQQVFDLTPVNAPYEVQTDVDSSESGFAKVGDKATLKFNTLEYMRYGEAYGSVSDISATSVNPQNTPGVQSGIQAAPTPGAPQDLYYTATVSLDELELHNVPQGFRLVPGMPVEVDMVVGRISVLNYFLIAVEPIIYQSMHEP